ncbi:MAG: hypothetical protein ACREXT_19275, partial [Gammaproteobacteria bacterium]
TEADLNSLRRDYIDRARDLGLSVFFNTTVTAANYDALSGLVQFFAEHSDVVRLCSFQLGAATGRGIGCRPLITPTSVQRTIEAALRTPLNFDAAGSGPLACNRYAYAVIINGKAYDLFADSGFVREMLAATAHLYFDRTSVRRALGTFLKFLLTRPSLLWGASTRTAQFAWRARADLIAARGRIRKLSFFIHSFMDAGALDRQRIAACSFMIMTPDGPLSMCLHNAKRDDYLLRPTVIRASGVLKYWDPTNGTLVDRMPRDIKVRLTRKNARGRAKFAIAQDPTL